MVTNILLASGRGGRKQGRERKWEDCRSEEKLVYVLQTELNVTECKSPYSQAIETKLVVDRYIDQISIIADQRKFVSALIVPEYKQVEEYAQKHGIAYASMKELLEKPEIIQLFQMRIDTLQQEFAHYEQIKRFTLLPEPFSMEKGELTNTLKIKRAVLLKNYAAEIEKMYAE